MTEFPTGDGGGPRGDRRRALAGPHGRQPAASVTQMLAWAADVHAHGVGRSDRALAAAIGQCISDPSRGLAMPVRVATDFVESLLLIAEDPDMFFVDDAGPFQPRFRYFPEQLIAALSLDRAYDTELNAAARSRVRAAVRNRADEGAS